MKDWLIRALKTFAQAFFGVLIPEVCLMLNGNLPDSIAGAKALLMPLICSALAAGISAAWNIILEHLKTEEVEMDD